MKDPLALHYTGFKPGQRKVLFTCFKRNDKREVKVAQLAGSVAEMSAYHHGEVSCSSICDLASSLGFHSLTKSIFIFPASSDDDNCELSTEFCRK